MIHLPSPILLYLADDCPLGRVDPSMFSQQTLMELVVEPSSTKPHWMKDRNDTYTDVLHWKGLYFDREGTNLERIHFRCFDFHSLDLRWIPQSVKEIHLQMYFLEGTLETSHLPHNLQSLTIIYTQMSGTIDFTRFPPAMICIELNNNKFAGAVDLQKLPYSLKKLDFRNNKFSGTLDFLHVPESLDNIDFIRNPFHGTISLARALRTTSGHQYLGAVAHIELKGTRFTDIEWESIPESVVYLDAWSNNLQCPSFFSKVPRHFQGFDLGSNELSGRISMEDLPKTIVVMKAKSNKFSGEMNFENLPEALVEMDLSDNRIRGTIDIGALPDKIKELNLGGNEICRPISLEKLPKDLRILILCNNRIEQEEVVFGSIHSNMWKVDLGGNLIRRWRGDESLSGVVQLDTVPSADGWWTYWPCQLQ